MRSGSVRILAVVVVVLFGALFALNTADRDSSESENELLVPELKSRLNDLESVTITDADGQVTIVREENAWRVREKAAYPADTAALRELLLAIAEAAKVEQKTANPALYDRLGVEDPARDGGNGVLVAANGPEFGFSLILGDSAQGDYRYARLPEQEQSWLIDRNPKLPDGLSGWLLDEIVDIPPANVRSVEIRHADGETIRLSKQDQADAAFVVEGIPEGRELSYPTVANGIAGALGKLTLEDVATEDGEAAPAAVDIRFETFDGLRLDVAAGDSEEETWITLKASAEPHEPAGAPAPPDADEAGETERGDTGTETDSGPAGAATDSPEAGTAETADRAPPEERAAAINRRTAGWRYRIAGYKADQLTRRWADLLKAESDDGE